MPQLHIRRAVVEDHDDVIPIFKRLKNNLTEVSDDLNPLRPVSTGLWFECNQKRSLFVPLRRNKGSVVLCESAYFDIMKHSMLLIVIAHHA